VNAIPPHGQELAMNRFGSTGDNWPYQPWPAHSETLSRWGDDTPVLVVGLAGAGAARLLAVDAGSETSSDSNLGSSAFADQHVAALVREHRCAVRGL
jgi:hypothetical protein